METATTAATRQKRFRRAIEPVGMQLTERDIRLLADVAQHRFLSSEHLHAMDGGSKRNLQRCLRTLYDHGYLDRPRAQLAHVAITGPKPIVYGLGQRGARALKENGHRITEGRDWTERNKRAGSIFIEHTLAVADFMVKLEVACRERDDVELLSEEEIIAQAPERTRSAREPLRWVAPSTGKREGESVVPDAAFALVFADGSASYFLLEVDRGTMPVVRAGNERTSYMRKLRTYWEGWRADRHVEQFGVKQVRVLTVTTSAKRVASMLVAVNDLTGGAGSNFFLFVDQNALAKQSALDCGWFTGKGHVVRLVD